MNNANNPQVFLVGAGPGDEGLITVKGLTLLKNAEVVIYDRLANPALLNFVDPKAEKIYVGKASGNHIMTQDEINSLLVEKGNTGKCVVRLKGGDPFVFGRGGEEALALKNEGIAFEIVPGVTSAVSVPAYAGIPITHRNKSSTVTFITGHEAGENNIDWKRFSPGKDTLVFLMGLSNLSFISNNLIKNGRDENTPTAVIENGTCNNQRIVIASLKEITEKVNKAGIKPPAIIVVGEVTTLHEQISWMEKRPLFGKKVLITRNKEAISEFSKLLSQKGAEVLSVPLIKIVPITIKKQMNILLEKPFDWFVFTSTNGVNYFFKALEENGMDSRIFKNAKIAVIGAKTATALKKYFLSADVVPTNYTAEALFDAMLPLLNKGDRILLPRAKEVRPYLENALTEAGAICNKLEVYETIPDEDGIKKIPEMLNICDDILFTSSSAVKVFVNALKENDDKIIYRKEKRPNIGAIGPITAKTLTDLNFPVDFTAKVYTLNGLTEALISFENSKFNRNMQ